MAMNAATPRTRPDAADFVIVGGGIIGVTLALEGKRRHPDASIVVLEKDDVGAHASGRNSGVLHAGFYYTADSLKARLSVEGNRRLTEYCLEKGLGINRCGKLVVASQASELAGVDELLRRGGVNGVDVRPVTEAEAKELEPRVKTVERALWSPTTSSVDPAEVMASLAADARAAGVDVRTGTAYVGYDDGVVRTSRGDIPAGYLVNAAGVYADRVARALGFSERYRILPLKGVYLYSDEPAGAFRRHIYPVPNLDNPFLGVHYTVGVHGKAKIGPTAMPAFWREHYDGLENFRPGELLDIVGREARLFLKNSFGFRRIAADEIRKSFRSVLVKRAARLATGVRRADYRTWGRPGIRAQLLDLETGAFEMDFRYEGDDRSFHVLNAVSPAFTCSLPFAELLWDEIEARTG